jgi:FHS family Na+ dependent glucose MFS transporter 1
MLWAGSILLGISLASIFPTFITLAEERMHVTGAITGWFLVGGGAGGMILPVLIGNAFENIGPNAMMTIVFATLLLDLSALFLFTKISVKAQTTGDKIPVEA